MNHRISDLGHIVAEVVGGVRVIQQDAMADPRDYRVSFEKIRRVLGFEPRYTVAAGVQEVAAAVRRDAALRAYQTPVYHNVHALKETFATPRRRREDEAPQPRLARA